jgi:hypothetical protein
VLPAPFLGAAAFVLAFSGDGRLPVLVGGDGVQDAGVQREGVAEPGDPEGLQGPVGAGHQRERSAPAMEFLPAAHQGAQARRVQESGAAQVRDDVNDPAAGHIDDPVQELRGGVRIDVAFDPQHSPVATSSDGLQLKGVHAASAIGGWWS